MSHLDTLFSLKGKTVLVTGGYRGLGLSLVKGFSGAGARVIVNGPSGAS